MKDVFLISSEAEIKRLSSLMNRASKAYYSLKNQETQYAKSLSYCYLMCKAQIEEIDRIRLNYKNTYPSLIK